MTPSPYDSDSPVVGIVMGSDSDWSVMEAAATVLEEFGIPYEADVVSAHRMPEDMIAYSRDYCWCWRCSTFAGDARLSYRPAGDWCAGAVKEPGGYGFPPVNCTDARRGSGGDCFN